MMSRIKTLKTFTFSRVAYSQTIYKYASGFLFMYDHQKLTETDASANNPLMYSCDIVILDIATFVKDWNQKIGLNLLA